MKGFFQPKVTKNHTESTIPKCGSCKLFRSCKSPKMPITGKGEKGILIFGEGPGETEDNQNLQFVGKAGQTLRSTLDKFGIDLDRDCWKTNSLICRPTETIEGRIHNRKPTSNEIDFCRPNLTNAIKQLNPKVIIPLGAVAVESLLTPLWREGIGPISKWVGWQIPLQKYNAWITPTYHPSYINRIENDREGSVVRLWFERHLEAAVKLDSRPWDVIPNYKNQVEYIFNTEQAVDRIEEVLESGKAFVWDLECEGLKPEREDFSIVSCAVSTGCDTFAYPWIGEAIQATGELLQGDNPKIGWNAKYESRWIKAKLGIDVKNWTHDGMLSTHHLDNRGSISSLKLQSFLLLGQEPYDTHISPYLKSTDETGKNRIREVDMKTILIYNGKDALINYLRTKLQKAEKKRK